MKVLTFFSFLSPGERVDVENGRSEMRAFERSSRRVPITTVLCRKAQGNVQLVFFLARITHSIVMREERQNK